MADQPPPADLPAEPYAAVMAEPSLKKNVKLMYSDQVMQLLAETISANLVNWQLVLAPPGKWGKGRFLDKLVDYITEFNGCPKAIFEAQLHQAGSQQ